VASTKAFTSQLVAIYLLALRLAQGRGTLSPDASRAHVEGLLRLPMLIEQALEGAPVIEAIAGRFHTRTDFLYLGRGINYPIALEGALKLKEISYIHAEGYPAGEMKHGPIALIDETVPVIVVAPDDELFEKTVSNLQEVAARGGQVILISDAAPEKVGCTLAAHIQMPKVAAFVAPMLYAVPIQLIAYHTAVLMGTDVDQPRNLAKSVTVE
jgi:glucosamine--fructose-6-phosphate aminotransferase (isomerizing)